MLHPLPYPPHSAASPRSCAYFILSFLIRNSCQENQLWPENEAGRVSDGGRGGGFRKGYFKYRPHRGIILRRRAIPILSRRGVFQTVKLSEYTARKTTIIAIYAYTYHYDIFETFRF